ncbi:MAG: ABC transporter substrate-binding protein [Sphingomonadaceae bacterium]|nr:ABC transporter substrate-binding protein [Sphingomonadaceae bacterium]
MFKNLVLFVALAAPVTARAQVTDPAAQRVESYFAALMPVMKGGAKLGIKGRADRYEPVVEQYYDAQGALRLIAGASYAQATAADRQAALTALNRLNAVRHAANFDSYSGEKFTVEPAVQTRGTDKLVRARITGSNGQGAALVYRLRPGSDGQWRILDVVSEGVSQLNVQRAEFAAGLKNGGLSGLTKQLNATIQRSLTQPA